MTRCLVYFIFHAAQLSFFNVALNVNTTVSELPERVPDAVPHEQLFTTSNVSQSDKLQYLLLSVVTSVEWSMYPGFNMTQLDAYVSLYFNKKMKHFSKELV